MQTIFYLSPLIALTLSIIAMMVVIFQFDQLRRPALKDWLARRWSPDRREILHLEKLNGFYYLVDRLIDWSDTLIRLSWLPALLALAGGARSTLLAVFLISLCCLIRYASLLRLATKRIAHFTTPINDDSMGIFARTTQDWRTFRNRMRAPFIASLVIATVFLLATILWE